MTSNDWINVRERTPVPINWKTFSHKDNVLIHFINNQGESEKYHFTSGNNQSKVDRMFYELVQLFRDK